MSPFELSGYDKKDLESAKHMFVSNSLSLRDKWLHEFGGTGALPVDAKKGKGKGHHVIYLVGADLISPTLWGKIQNLFV
jgi:hypothetical protein